MKLQIFFILLGIILRYITKKTKQPTFTNISAYHHENKFTTTPEKDTLLTISDWELKLGKHTVMAKLIATIEVYPRFNQEYLLCIFHIMSM